MHSVSTASWRPFGAETTRRRAERERVEESARLRPHGGENSTVWTRVQSTERILCWPELISVNFSKLDLMISWYMHKTHAYLFIDCSHIKSYLITTNMLSCCHSKKKKKKKKKKKRKKERLEEKKTLCAISFFSFCQRLPAILGCLLAKDAKFVNLQQVDNVVLICCPNNFDAYYASHVSLLSISHVLWDQFLYAWGILEVLNCKENEGTVVAFSFLLVCCKLENNTKNYWK